MGQVLHGGARTTEAVRRAIQLRQESVRAAARRYGVSPTTVQKWRQRSTAADARMGPKEARSTVLTPEEEAIVVAFRRHTLLPLDDCLYGLQPTIPHLTRSALHRCLQRHGISRLPEIEGDKPQKKRFAAYPIGYFHLDIAEVRTAEGKLHLFVAVDRASKLAFAKLEGKANIYTASDFLRALIEAVPYRVHTVLTDNGVQFCDAPGRGRLPARPRRGGALQGAHRADRQRRAVHGHAARRRGPRGRSRHRRHLGRPRRAPPLPRPRLRAARHRAPPDQGEPPLDHG